MFGKKKKRVAYLRSIWGKSLDKYRDFDLIALYHNMIKSNGDGVFVDDRTWNDLDFNSVYSLIDRNISGVGQQYLYHLLHRYEKDEDVLKRRFKLISEFKRNRVLRENVQLSLLRLSGSSSYFISYLALSKDLPFTKYYPLFYLCSLLSVASLFLISFKGVFLLLALSVLLMNLIINKIFSKNIYEYFTGFSGLNTLILSAISIGKITTPVKIEELNFLRRQVHLLTSLKKKLGYLVIDKVSLNEFARAGIEYLNMFLLYDIITYYRSVNILRKHQNEIRKVFETVAWLDASIAISSYLAEVPLYSKPIFNSSNTISFRNLYHPLIQDAVMNSVENISDSSLITGSNMSGKTTFIKTVGINFILSQALYFSLSDEIILPKRIVRSAIRRNEDLEEGKSYFFVEIELLNEFVRLSEENERYLFLIDEIFRGTNTVERLASSTAVLKYLNAKNTVFVTTHDIELQSLLENNFGMFHFSEQVENGRFFFDYKIKPGPCSSGNAIKLLGIMKYPYSILEEAETIVKKLSSNGTMVVNKIK